MKYKYSDDAIRAAVATSITYAEAMSRLGMNASGGGSYSYFKRRIEAIGVDTSHFRGRGWARGRAVQTPRQGRPLEEYLCLNGPHISSHSLKKKLIKQGLRKEQCEGCHRKTWQGRTIPLELHHGNGNPRDNRSENLRVLCANCHAQQPNNCKQRAEEVIKFEVYTVAKEPYKRPTKIRWPEVEDLRGMVERNGYLATGKLLGVTDNAIRKHLNRHKTMEL